MTDQPKACADCFRVRYSESLYEAEDGGARCGLRKTARPLCIDQRAKGGACGPDGKLWERPHGVNA